MSMVTLVSLMNEYKNSKISSSTSHNTCKQFWDVIDKPLHTFSMGEPLTRVQKIIETVKRLDKWNHMYRMVPLWTCISAMSNQTSINQVIAKQQKYVDAIVVTADS